MDIQIDMGVEIAIDTKITCNSNGHPYRYGISIRRVILINMTHLLYSHGHASNETNNQSIYSHGVFFSPAQRLELNSIVLGGWMDYSCNYMQLINYYCHLPCYLPDDN